MGESGTATRKARLRELIEQRSLLTGAGFRLASGASTGFYFDMKRSMFEPEAANLIAELVLEAIGDAPCELVGGLELGAVPLVAGVAQKSFLLRPKRPIAGFFVRKQAKEHGTRRLIEGLAEGETLAGRDVVVLEDVTTTGGSSLQAVAAARAAGARVARVVTVVDRQAGAAETMRGQGLELIPILTLDDFRL